MKLLQVEKVISSKRWLFPTWFLDAQRKLHFHHDDYLITLSCITHTPRVYTYNVGYLSGLGFTPSFFSNFLKILKILENDTTIIFKSQFSLRYFFPRVQIWKRSVMHEKRSNFLRYFFLVKLHWKHMP